MGEQHRSPEIIQAYRTLAERYIAIIDTETGVDDYDKTHTSLSYLRGMCRFVLNDERSSTDTIAFQLGRVQGALVERGIVNMEVEMDVSRPIFRQAYNAMIQSSRNEFNDRVRSIQGQEFRKLLLKGIVFGSILAIVLWVAT